MSKEAIVLLPLTLIKKWNTVSVVLAENRVDFELDFGHTYYLHRFDFEEWGKFVNGINKADKKLKEIRESSTFRL
ncbi:hypothetical protein ES703_30721 [subsurface metagenome]